MALPKFLKKIDETLFGRVRNQFALMLEKECAGCESLLDVGCGANSPVRAFSKKIPRVVGVDNFQPSIDKSRAAGIHGEYRKMNVLEMDKKFPPESFDVVVALDLIEHLEKKDALRLIEVMERLARRKVIIFTPNGFLEQHEFDGNRSQVHISGWEIDEMRALGYRVSGVHGWKALRSECAYIKWKPRKFWVIVSVLSLPWTTRHPRRAFHIFCVKDKLPPRKDR
ncbi:MAG: class I SAM-dependent methyltransferase [Candidatus Aminicenantes bacterium]|nr:class I SAM-dependent methyltransferase [Candidatus Aminicenantes bacterium]